MKNQVCNRQLLKLILAAFLAYFNICSVFSIGGNVIKTIFVLLSPSVFLLVLTDLSFSLLKILAIVIIFVYCYNRKKRLDLKHLNSFLLTNLILYLAFYFVSMVSALLVAYLTPHIMKLDDFAEYTKLSHIYWYVIGFINVIVLIVFGVVVLGNIDKKEENEL